VSYLQANGFDAKLTILQAYQWPLLGSPESAAAAQAIVAAQGSPTLSGPGGGGASVVPAPAVVSGASTGSFAVGGPFDPDPAHALLGSGGPNDPDAAHRQARQADEQRYLELHGTPWDHAVYVTAPRR
jgi:hypothetical protein